MISGCTFPAVVSRLKSALSLRSDKELAAALGMNPNALYNRKHSGSVPYEEVVLLAEKRRLSLDWLLFGKGELSNAEQANVDPTTMGIILLELERAAAPAGEEDPDVVVASARKGIIAAQIYNDTFLIDDEGQRKSAIYAAARDWAAAARALEQVTAHSTASKVARGAGARKGPRFKT